ncbi:lactonase family protein [Curvibacter sp. CHRR-16]|uniref:lactonase family protein n=1 Tax=Curvibacter sp. CHRR-16 TaxID=2835872 RepID=UPI001BDB3DA9|nr:beta-propeller fold lactonase family protein [Curvibacter sp. CHRR-16]MBT0569196.1 lactonase family protein [Curvibacter sp. CHRR-16]
MPHSVDSKAFVYVSNAQSRDISVFSLDWGTGALAWVQTMPVEGMVMPMALSPDKRMLYAALRSQPYTVVALHINADTGELSMAGSAPLPDSMANIALDRSGHLLMAASYGGNLVSISPLDAQGIPQPASQVLSTPPKAHQIAASDDNRTVYVTSLGGDQLLSFTLDWPNKALQAHAEPAAYFPHQSGPRHFVWSADKRFMYVLGELDAQLYVLQRQAQGPTMQIVQTLSALPDNFVGAASAADLHCTPNGRFVYASERGSNTLAGFAVDPVTGLLRKIGQWSTEAQPRGFRISPDGRFLLVVGQMSHAMSIHQIDATTGNLQLLSTVPTGQNPNWVEIAQFE